MCSLKDLMLLVANIKLALHLEGKLSKIMRLLLYATVILSYIVKMHICCSALRYLVMLRDESNTTRTLDDIISRVTNNDVNVLSHRQCLVHAKHYDRNRRPLPGHRTLSVIEEHTNTDP